jgi:spore maturation protein CgeB
MLVKNILLVGQFVAGALERFYVEGLQQSGVTVTPYNIAGQYFSILNKSLCNRVINKLSPDTIYKPLNDQFVQWIDKKKFDVILVFKGMELFPETVKLLRKHAKVVANLNADHPFEYYSAGAGNKNVYNSISHFDVHFSYAKSIVEQLKSTFKKDAYCIPFGYSTSVKPAVETTSPKYNNRVLFVGQYDDERASYLNKLKFKGLDIYGNLKWKTRNFFRPYIQMAYKNKPLFDKEYVDAVISCTGMINLLRKQNIVEDSHNMRTFEVPGYGGLLIAQRTKEQQEYFEEDKEAIYFDSQEELKDKLTFLCDNDTTAQQIKKAGHERAVRSNYSYDHRSREMLGYLQQYFSA